jgi:hypothetical protein
LRQVEIIRLRSSSDLERCVEAKYETLLKDSLKTPGLELVSVMWPLAHCTECMLIFVWEAVEPNFFGSPLADTLVRELKKDGIIDYSVWVERFRKGEVDRHKSRRSRKARKEC